MTRWTNTGFVAWIYPTDLAKLKQLGSMTMFDSQEFARKSTPQGTPVRVRVVLERAKPNAVKRERKRAERSRAKAKAPTTRRK